jgi:hypothetical protein
VIGAWGAQAGDRATRERERAPLLSSTATRARRRQPSFPTHLLDSEVDDSRSTMGDRYFTTTKKGKTATRTNAPRRRRRRARAHFSPSAF